MEIEYSFFNVYFCHVCKTKESFIHAKPCSRCKLISYCSKEHQKLDWDNHKSVCNAVRGICRKKNADDVFEAEVKDFKKVYPATALTKPFWKSIKLSLVTKVLDLIKRNFKEYEMNMLNFPKHCAVCFARNIKLELVCTTCYSAAYCSEEHRSLDDHDKVCSGFQRTLDVNLYLLNVDFDFCKTLLIDPAKAANLNLNAYDMKSFIGKYVKPGVECGEEALLSFLNTCVLTFAYAVSRVPHFTLGKKLTIHIVGAVGPFEGRSFEYWENLLHLFPKVRAVTLVFIGPNIAGPPTKLNLCGFCKKLNKTVNIVVFKTSYHEYNCSGQSQKPDAIIAFNSGLWRNSALYGGILGSGVDLWVPSFPYFFQYANVPVILTEKGKDETDSDLERLKDVIREKNVRVVLNGEPNPYRDLIPWNIWTCDDNTFPTKNSFVSVLVARK